MIINVTQLTCVGNYIVFELEEESVFNSAINQRYFIFMSK